MEKKKKKLVKAIIIATVSIISFAVGGNGSEIVHTVGEVATEVINVQ